MIRPFYGVVQQWWEGWRFGQEMEFGGWSQGAGLCWQLWVGRRRGLRGGEGGGEEVGDGRG